jgi:small-conductance mechanosensitive channel
MLNITSLSIIGGILCTSYFIANYISSKAKVKIIKFFYQKKERLDATNFIFKLFIQCLTPFIFILIASLLSFTLPLTLGKLQIPILQKIPFLITVSAVSFSVKFGLIWLLYRIANISSVSRAVNKIFAIGLLLLTAFNFIGLNDYIVKFLDGFRTNFGSFELSIYKVSIFFVIFAGLFWFNRIFLECLKKGLDTTEIGTNTKVLLLKFFGMILLAFAVITALSSTGLDIKSLTIFGSALVVGLGFGFQKLVSNVISGITISFEEIIKEGDIILIDDKREIKGVVKSLNMRYVLIAEFDGKEVIVPNDTILTSNIANLTHSHNLLRIRADITLPINIDIEAFRIDIMRIMNSNPYASKVEECVFHIEKLSEIGIHAFLFFWTDNPFDVNVARTSLMSSVLNYIKEKEITLPEPITKITR